MYFLSVFPQLTSRICHAHADVWEILRQIIIKTFMAYPHHVFWHMVALSKSSYPQRAKRCKEIFDYVIVATGHFWAPNFPEFPGIDKFPGRVYMPMTTNVQRNSKDSG